MDGATKQSHQLSCAAQCLERLPHVHVIVHFLLYLSSNTYATKDSEDRIRLLIIFVASFASKRQDALGRSLPQIIAHRGNKATHPENSLRAFEDAVDAGAHALETDLHLTKDGVVVLSHVRSFLTKDWRCP